jgi:hypothetical protein
MQSVKTLSKVHGTDKLDPEEFIEHTGVDKLYHAK